MGILSKESLSGGSLFDRLFKKIVMRDREKAIGRLGIYIW